VPELRDALPLLASLSGASENIGLSLDDGLDSVVSALTNPDLCADVLDALVDAVLPHAGRPLVAIAPGLLIIREQRIDVTRLLTRTQTMLSREGIETWADLSGWTIDEFAALRSVGSTTVRDAVGHALRESLIHFAKPPARVPTREVLPLPEATHRSAEMLAALGDDVRTLAGWATATGLTTLGDTIAHATDRSELPGDIVDVWRRITGYAVRELADADLVAAGVATLADELLDGLSDAARRIVLARVIDVEGTATLETLGNELGVTRERVRQIQLKAHEHVADRLRGRRMALLRWRAHELRTTLGSCALVGHPAMSEAIDVALADVPPEREVVVADLLLWLAGPYRRDGEWLLLRGCEPRNVSLVSLVDEQGSLSVERAHEWLANQGVRAPFRDAWLEAQRMFRRFDDSLLLWTGSVVDKSVRLLARRQAPATAEALVAEIGEGHSARAARNNFFGDPRLVRVNRTEWALAEWGLEEYSTITGEITERIELHGGAVRLDDVVAELTTTFDVNPGSVRAFAEAPLFVIDDGMIRLRTDDEPYAVDQPVASVRGLYLRPDGGIAMCVVVDGEVLRGSGRGCPIAVAIHLGVRPGARRRLTGPQGSLMVSWPITSAFGPTLGTVRELVGAAGADLGEAVRLDLDGTLGTVAVTRIPRDQGDLPGAERLALHTGYRVDEANALETLAGALGVPPSDVRRKLRDRGDGAIADLLPSTPVDPTLAAALSELASALEKS
jgi:DNA polymerase-3 subunit epsilon